MKELFNLQDLGPLFSVLRQEIIEYGVLAQMLEEHQRLIFYRDQSGIMELNLAISEHICTTEILNKKQNTIVADLLTKADETKKNNIRILSQYCLGNASKMLESLLDEFVLTVKSAHEKLKLNRVYLNEALVEINALAKKLPKQQSIYNKKGMICASRK